MAIKVPENPLTLSEIPIIIPENNEKNIIEIVEIDFF